MRKGSIIGYDLNDRGCQISYYDEITQEPLTLEAEDDYDQIPMVLGYSHETWSYGKDAVEMERLGKGVTVSGLLSLVMLQEKIEIEGTIYESVWLLAKFVHLSLQKFQKIDGITFSVPKMNIDLAKILKGVAQRIGVRKENVYVQDYKESFCQYMFYQPKELWQYEAALFYCDHTEIRAFMLRKVKSPKTTDERVFVTVDEVAGAQISEMEAVYSMVDKEAAKNADLQFKRFIEGVFEKKLISSVYLTGEGFDTRWFPDSLKVLCNGRKAFAGNNLYSKGACYTAFRRHCGFWDGAVYLDETKMMEQISVKVRKGEGEFWQPLVFWGARWYESDGEWEAIADDLDEINIIVESLVTGEKRHYPLSLKGFPRRKGYSVRLKIQVIFEDEKMCKISVEDIGFGEFFAPAGRKIERKIQLGGSNGQFNSLL